MPVHLGSMGESHQDRDRARTPGSMKPGDVYVLNDPYNGGTHLPDVTVDDAGVRRGRRGEILFYVGCARPPRRHRRHHAGLDAALLAHRRGRGRADRQLQAGRERPHARGARCARCSRAARYPARNPDQNIADLRAQVAANEKGARSCCGWSRTSASTSCSAYMRHVQDNAEESVRRVIGVLKDGAFDYAMDNGAVIRVKITRRRATRAAPPSTSPAPARSSRATSTRPPPWCTPPCSTSSARWWTTTSR